MKFSIKDCFSKCDQILRKLRIWSYLLKKSLIENFIFCAIIFLDKNIINIDTNFRGLARIPKREDLDNGRSVLTKKALVFSKKLKHTFEFTASLIKLFSNVCVVFDVSTEIAANEFIKFKIIPAKKFSST